MKWVYFFIFLLVLVAAFLGGTSFVDLDALAVDVHYRPAQRWFDVVHIGWNSFHTWAGEPFITTQFARALNLVVSPGDILAPLVILFIGTSFFIAFYSSNAPFVRGAVGGVLAVAILLALFGFDTVVVSSLSYVPALAICLLLARALPPSTVGILCLSCGVMVALSANALAPLVVLFCLAMAWQGNIESKAIDKSSILAVFLPALAMLVLHRTPVFPTYPQLSHVVQDDSIAGMFRAWLGPTPPIPIIDRVTLRASFELAAIVIFACSVLLLFLESSLKVRAMLLPAAVLALLVALDVALPEWLSQIGPLASIARIIPGYFLFALTAPLMALALWSILAGIFSNGGKASLSIVFAVIALSSYAVWRYRITPPLLVSYSDISMRRELMSTLGGDKGKLRYVVSPSYKMIANHGAWLLEKEHQSRAFQVVDIKGCTIYSSHRGDLVKLSHDGRQHSRWSPHLSRQNGDEWLAIICPSPIRMGALELSPGTFYSDFPRGIRVSVANSCSHEPGSRVLGDWHEVYNQPHWLGPLYFTENGYPHYGRQWNVKLKFIDEHEGRCVLIEQIGKEPHFDWSVAEINVFR